MHWWSFLDIHLQKDLLLFDSFGFVGFNLFIIYNDSAVIDKLLYNLKKKNPTNNHIKLVSPIFSIETYKKIKGKISLENITDTVEDFFHMIFQLTKLKGQKKTNENYICSRSISRIYDRHMRNMSTLLL